MFVIELHSNEQEFLGPYISEESDRPCVIFVSDADGCRHVGSVFTADEVDDVRTDLMSTGDILTIKTPVD